MREHASDVDQIIQIQSWKMEKELWGAIRAKN